MMNYTQEDLLRYLYGETSPQKSEAIKKALEADFSLREQMEQLKQSQQLLSEVNVKPRKELLQNILQYAEANMAKALPNE